MMSLIFLNFTPQNYNLYIFPDLEDQFKENNQVVRADEGNFAVLQCHPPDHFGSYVRFS